MKNSLPRDFEIEFHDDDTFTLTTYGKEKEAIKIRLDLRILPMEQAMNAVVGSARSEPNHSP